MSDRTVETAEAILGTAGLVPPVRGSAHHAPAVAGLSFEIGPKCEKGLHESLFVRHGPAHEETNAQGFG